MNGTRRYTLVPRARRLAATLAVCACACGLMAARAQATVGVVGLLGGATSGAQGGQFDEPGGIAVNQSTRDFYVADSRNDRVQEFTPAGELVRAWGVGVVASGPDAKPVVDEVKSVVVEATTGTSYVLGFNGLEFFGDVIGGEETSSIPVGASASAVESALNALPGIGGSGGVVTVTGAGTVASPYIVTFGGSLGGVKHALGATFGDSGVTVTATTVTAASAPFEDCVPANGDTCRAGVASAEAGGMDDPRGVAVEAASGNVFVTDEANMRVDVFSSTGVFEGAFGWKVDAGDPGEELQFCTTTTTCQAGTSGTGAGEFGATIGNPAWDARSTSVYVADPANRRIDEFSPTLTAGEVTGVAFVRGYGWGVSNDADEFQSCTATCVAGLSGSGLGEFGFESPQSIAVDNQGDVYAADGGNERVQKFNAAGEPLGNFATAQLSGAPAVSNVAVNSVTGDLLAVKECSAATCPSEAKLAYENRIYEFGASGNLLTTYGAGDGIAFYENGSSYIRGLAVASSGAIYLSEDFYAAEGPMWVFTLNTIVEPTLTAEAAIGVNAHEATLHGTIDPAENPSNQLQTGYQFEVSVNGSSWVKAGSAGKVAAGETPVAVSRSVTGLEAHTVYWVRLHAEKEYASAGITTTSADEFTTASSTPAVSDLSVSDVEASSALLAAGVNPEGAETTYRIEYGPTTAYGSSLPVGAAEASVGSGDGAAPVSARLSGLFPGTLYHYRVVAENANGSGEATGTFTTVAATLPEALTGTASGVAQNTATISGVISTNGQATSYGFEIATSPEEYGPPTGLGHVGAGESEVPVSLGLTGLTPGTIYYYRTEAGGTNGTDYGAVQSFTTTAYASEQATPPATPPFVSVPSIALPATETGAVAKVTTKTLSRARKLKAALKVCKKDVRHAKRQKCEKEARVKFGPARKKKKRAVHKK